MHRADENGPYFLPTRLPSESLQNLNLLPTFCGVGGHTDPPRTPQFLIFRTFLFFNVEKKTVAVWYDSQVSGTVCKLDR